MEFKPVFYSSEMGSLEDFMRQVPPENVIDSTDELLRELFLIRNPQYRFNPNYAAEQSTFVAANKDSIRWVFFPWNRTICTYLPDEMHQEIRTARNKNLITSAEQRSFYDFPLAIAGLSVGSHPALTIAMMGGAGKLKIADPDVISPTNLNRIRTDFTRVGRNKCTEVAQALYQINPYTHIDAYSEGVKPEMIEEFLTRDGKVGALVEEVDNLGIKIMLRLKAKELGIPVITATDNGDGIMIDIERYDEDPNLELFNGAIGHVTLEEFQKFSPMDLPRLATKIAGPQVAAPKMLESVLEVGRTIYSWPQLGDAANLAGTVVAYIVRRLALGLPLQSGKYEVNLDAIFDPLYNSSEAHTARETLRADCLKKIGLTS